MAWKVDDDMHQLILASYSATKLTHPILKRLSTLADEWVSLAQQAEYKRTCYFACLEELAARADEAGRHGSELGAAIRYAIASDKQLGVARSKMLEVYRRALVVPITAKEIELAEKSVHSSEKSYTHQVKQYTREVMSAKSLADKEEKKMFKTGHGARSVDAAQVNLSDRMADLENFRDSTYAEALAEERGRYLVVLGGLTDVFERERELAAMTDPMLEDVADQLKRADNLPPPARSRRRRMRRPDIQPPAGGPGGPPGGSTPGGFSRHSPNRWSAHFAPQASGDTARARYAFNATRPGMMSLNEGDIIELEGPPEDTWQFGRNVHTQESGWFPAAYVDTAARRPVGAVSVLPRQSFDRFQDGSQGPRRSQANGVGNAQSKLIPEVDY